MRPLFTNFQFNSQKVIKPNDTFLKIVNLMQLKKIKQQEDLIKQQQDFLTTINKKSLETLTFVERNVSFVDFNNSESTLKEVVQDNNKCEPLVEIIDEINLNEISSKSLNNVEFIIEISNEKNIDSVFDPVLNEKKIKNDSYIITSKLPKEKAALRKKFAQREKRKNRVREELKKKNIRNLHRFSVFISNKRVHVQIIDDINGKTILSEHSLNFERSPGKYTFADKCKIVGKSIAEKCLAKNIHEVVFDRGSKHFAGNIRALAYAAREAGLQF